jgi:uncharacterized protein (DUF342 family)
LIWRAGGMAFVAICAYILQVGDIYNLDWHLIVNTGTIVFIGLIAGEITKLLNNK